MAFRPVAPGPTPRSRPPGTKVSIDTPVCPCRSGTCEDRGWILADDLRRCVAGRALECLIGIQDEAIRVDHHDRFGGVPHRRDEEFLRGLRPDVAGLQTSHRSGPRTGGGKTTPQGQWVVASATTGISCRSRRRSMRSQRLAYVAAGLHGPLSRDAAPGRPSLSLAAPVTRAGPGDEAGRRPRGPRA